MVAAEVVGTEALTVAVEVVKVGAAAVGLAAVVKVGVAAEVLAAVVKVGVAAEALAAVAAEEDSAACSVGPTHLRSR